MKKLLLFILFGLTLQLHAQEHENIFFEKTANGLTKFYYDKNYFLCPKDCEFKFIERVVAFDTKTSKFNGEFKDFGPDGHVLLTGTYLNGEKQGEFKAYHSNQQLKWTVTFKDDIPVGDWHFYYPDGKPLMVLTIQSYRLLIKSFWNQKAQQKIIDGNGEYDFTLYFESFTELGFPAYRRRGKVVDGLANGMWHLFMIDGKKSTLAREEFFSKGVFKNYGEIYYELDKDEKHLQLYPIDNFNRAELLTYKNCTFDDYSGFLAYLSASIKEELPTFKNYLERKPTEFEYQVSVNKKGKPSNENLTTVTSESLKPYLQEAISYISYYLPTFSNGVYIDDTLKISGKLMVDDLGEADIYDLRIKRSSEE